jgi:hypothetical protein
MKSYSSEIPNKAATVTPEQLEAVETKWREHYVQKVQKAFRCHAIVYVSLFVINLIVTIALFVSQH